MDSIASILQTISPYIQEFITSGDESLQYFRDESGRDLLSETMGRYVTDFNQANKGAMDSTYRAIKAKGGDTNLNSSAMLQREFQTALGRAQAAQSGRRAETSRRDQIQGNLLEAGLASQGLAGEIGSSAYTADQALAGDQARAGATVSSATISANASRYRADKEADVDRYNIDRNFETNTLDRDALTDYHNRTLDLEEDYNIHTLESKPYDFGNGAFGFYDYESNTYDVQQNPLVPGVGQEGDDYRDWFVDNGETAMSNFGRVER